MSDIIDNPTTTETEFSAIVTIAFAGTEPKTYAANLTPASTISSEQYAKLVSETVERTVLLHYGALPVLTVQEPTA